jgi:hypothetical protein
MQHHRQRRPARLPSAVDCSSRRWWVLAVAVRRADQTFRESTPWPRGRQHSVCRSLAAAQTPTFSWHSRTISHTGTPCPQQQPHPPTPASTHPRAADSVKPSNPSRSRLASLLDVPLVQAAQNVVPVAVTAGDKIEGLRQWASGRCLSADRAGVYSRPEVGSGERGRRVVREPGVN